MERRIRTRGYELDLRGKVRPSTVLRYLEHLRWEAVAETPAVAGTFAHGHRLVVVAQRLRLARALSLGEELSLSLWVARVGRSSLDFGHRITVVRPPREERGDHADEQELFAEARVTAVHLGPDGRPAPISEEVRALARPEAALDGFPPPLEEAPLAGGWGHRFRVPPRDLDLLQHVNHAIYLDYAEDVRALAAAAGALGAHGRAPLRAVTLEYRHEALQGDELEARVLPLAENELGFQLRRGDELLCAARLLLAAG